MTALLEIENLSTRHSGGLKLAGISLRVDRGELVSILGANGAGKTSLLATIAGIFRPDEGQIRFEGREIGGHAPHRIVRDGLVMAPQNHPIFESLTVTESLTLGREQVGDDVFQLFPNLARKRFQRAGRLSGGERQMLSMAMALSTAPKLCLLDEPSSGLAPMIVHDVFQAIRQLVRGGLTVLMVEQNAKAALDLSDRAYVLEQGRIVMEGTASKITADEHIRRAYLGI